MAGYLDLSAPSIEAEMSRYLDTDILGKMIFKNFAQNVLRIPESDIKIPIARWGDLADGRAVKCDALVECERRKRKVELKFSRVSVANRHLGNTRKNWVFGRLLTTPDGKERRYDIAVCIGSALLGMESPEYWQYLDSYRRKMLVKKIPVEPSAKPYEPAFLSMCGFFIMPRRVIEADLFRARFGVLEKCRYRDYFAWGHEEAKCRQLWNQALESAGGHGRAMVSRSR